MPKFGILGWFLALALGISQLAQATINDCNNPRMSPFNHQPAARTLRTWRVWLDNSTRYDLEAFNASHAMTTANELMAPAKALRAAPMGEW